MKVAEVQKLPVKERFWYFVKERWAVLQRRLGGLPKPWTDDEVLRTCWFCNVRRRDDKTSVWLTDWYSEACPFGCPNEAFLVAAVLARQLNWPETLQDIGFPWPWNPEHVKDKIEQRKARGDKCYSNAYMISANHGPRGRERQAKSYQTAYLVCDPVARAVQGGFKLDTDTMQGAWSQLLGFPGLASFMAGQVVADLRWVVPGKWSDRKSWAPVGPGSSSGACVYFDLDVTPNMPQERWLPYFARLLQEAQDRSRSKSEGPDMPQGMEAMDWQNCLCEFFKYHRTLCDPTKSRFRYPGDKDVIEGERYRMTPLAELLGVRGEVGYRKRRKKKGEELSAGTPDPGSQTPPHFPHGDADGPSLPSNGHDTRGGTAVNGAGSLRGDLVQFRDRLLAGRRDLVADDLVLRLVADALDVLERDERREPSLVVALADNRVFRPEVLGHVAGGDDPQLDEFVLRQDSLFPDEDS